jgi:O-antigen ligase
MPVPTPHNGDAPDQESPAKMIEQENVIINRIMMLVLLCYPALLLTVRGGMNALFLLLLLASALSLYLARKASTAKQWGSHSIAFALAMASPILAIFLSQAYHGEFKFSAYDWAARFLLSIPIFLAMRRINMRYIAILQYGLPLGALAGLFSLLLKPYVWEGQRSTTSQFFNLIHFADLALILGFLSLFSINWVQRDRLPLLLLKICGFCAGLYMSVQSGERGGWIAIPPLMLVWAMSRNGKNLWVKLAIAALVTLSAIWLGYALIDVVKSRIDVIFHDLAQYADGNKDTSLGIRLQLWQAAWHLFTEYPVFGVGPEGFARMMPALGAGGMLTPMAASLGGAEVHNEILSKMAGLGIFGLLSILSVHLVPLAIFLRSAKSSSAQARSTGFMGICLVLGFFIFGLTVEIFNLKMTAAFYSATVTVLAAAAARKTTS